MCEDQEFESVSAGGPSGAAVALESNLIHRLCNRDPTALADIYDHYAPKTFGVLMRITKDVSVSEQLVQELFLKVWSLAAQFDHARGSLEVWLVCAARNLALDYQRSLRGRIPKRILPVDRTILAGSAHPKAGFVRSRHASSALAELSYSERQVIELAYFGGYTQTEIASLIAEPLGTVKSWMRSGLARLRENNHSKHFAQDAQGASERLEDCRSTAAAKVTTKQGN